jgi:arylsulfatase A
MDFKFHVGTAMLHKLPFFVCLSCLLWPGFAVGQEGKGKLPNIVIVLADDLGWGDLGCYGHPVIKTPNLDNFAKQGMRFTQCYSASSVCSPSRSAILTGRTPYRNGVFTWIPEGSNVHLRTSEITIVSLLRQLGYATCHVGKWHLNGLFNSPKQPQPGDHGYDWWLATQNNAAPSHKNPNNFARNGKTVGAMEGFSAPLVADEAVRWLTKERDQGKPFFLAMWTHEPHLPIESDPQFQKLYPDLVKADPDVAQHHANVTQLDAAFGKLMKTLDDLKLTDNTIVIFTSDNGPEGNGLKGRTRGSTGGLRGRKRSLYQGGIRVPGIMRWPSKIKANTESNEPIIGSDIFPSLCAITGIPLPRDRVIDGASFLPVFENKTIDRKIPMYWRYHDAGDLKVAIREGDWNLLANLNFTQFELYNLKDDPRQTRDLHGQEKDRFESLKKTLIQLNTEIEKEGPDWWKGYSDKKKKAAPNQSSRLLLPLPRMETFSAPVYVSRTQRIIGGAFTTLGTRAKPPWLLFPPAKAR